MSANISAGPLSSCVAVGLYIYVKSYETPTATSTKLLKMVLTRKGYVCSGASIWSFSTPGGTFTITNESLTNRCLMLNSSNTFNGSFDIIRLLNYLTTVGYLQPQDTLTKVVRNFYTDGSGWIGYNE